ncbi:hypothetical protein DFR49_3379 [Hephaestia caeni]|uniref:Uncharacterized protein n=1 Tax=Hephaestia caeni TaxID=645617 RepID=A0A397NUV6_9SPHN|nr:hypothetical protein [Hephaestia caeni]RIA37494.1 hypothetical protein DFR49_3379 [Hephaestia caeni]
MTCDHRGMAETARRHAMAMTAASRDHGDRHPEEADVMAATMGAAMQLGTMVAALIDLKMIAPGAGGTLMTTLCRLAEDTAAEMVGAGG